MSNDVMARQKPSKKSVQASRHGIPKASSMVEEPTVAFRSFKVTHAGRQKQYQLRRGFGYLVPIFRKAESLAEIGQLVEAGIPSRQIAPLVEYLGMKVPDIARAASVSPSTVSRWKAGTPIGEPGSNQFFRIDEVIRKGVELFGDLGELRVWLQSPNLALGNQIPMRLLTSQIGLELVDEALEALHYGNVM